MYFSFYFKRRFIAFFLLSVVINVHRPVNGKYIPTGKEEAVAVVNMPNVLRPSSHNNLTIYSTNSRPIRSNTGTQNGRKPLFACETINYNFHNETGRRSSCPFEWVVNYESRRIPEQILEQVCLGCGSCAGHRNQCTQLIVHQQIFFWDTAEYSSQVVRSGCVCMKKELGTAAHTLGRLSPLEVNIGDETVVN